MKMTTNFRILKRKIRIALLLVLALCILSPQTLDAQSWGGKRKAGFLDSWAINANMGLSSFFGDLSQFDTEISKKLTEESGLAYGLIATKYVMNDKIGISGQLLFGNLKGANAYDVSFESKFSEYNFHARFNLINIFSPYNMSKMGIEVLGGLGQFTFKTTQYDRSQEELQINIEDTGTPEFVYFFGLDLFYKVSEKIRITADFSMRQAGNDKLDDLTKNDNNDYYSYVSLGLTYYIYSFKKASVYSRRGASTRGRYPGRLPMRRRR
jgi:hypothetical protein